MPPPAKTPVIRPVSSIDCLAPGCDVSGRPAWPYHDGFDISARSGASDAGCRILPMLAARRPVRQAVSSCPGSPRHNRGAFPQILSHDGPPIGLRLNSGRCIPCAAKRCDATAAALRGRAQGRHAGSTPHGQRWPNTDQRSRSRGRPGSRVRAGLHPQVDLRGLASTRIPALRLFRARGMRWAPFHRLFHPGPRTGDGITGTGATHTWTRRPAGGRRGELASIADPPCPGTTIRSHRGGVPIATPVPGRFRRRRGRHSTRGNFRGYAPKGASRTSRRPRALAPSAGAADVAGQAFAPRCAAGTCDGVAPHGRAAVPRAIERPAPRSSSARRPGSFEPAGASGARVVRAGPQVQSGSSGFREPNAATPRARAGGQGAPMKSRWARVLGLAAAIAASAPDGTGAPRTTPRNAIGDPAQEVDALMRRYGPQHQTRKLRHPGAEGGKDD